MMKVIVFLLLVSLTMSQDEFSMQQATLGGYGELHINGDLTDGSDGQFNADFHRFVLFIGYSYTDTWSFKSELELEHNFVQEGQGELELEQAFVEYRSSDEFAFRAGVLLVPVGYINEIHEPPTFFGVERPRFDSQILPTTWFDNGVSVSGKISGAYYYHAMITGSLNGDGLASGIRGGRTKGFKGAIGGFNMNNPSFILRSDYFGIENVNIGLSFFANDARRLTGSAIQTRLLEFHSKYVTENVKMKAQFAQTSFSNLDYDGQFGWLAEIGYDVLDDERELSPFVRVEGLSLRQGHNDADTEDAANETILTIGLAFKPISQIVFKADYSRIEYALSASTAKQTASLGVGYAF